jgi:hypothetical protein
MGRGRHRQGSSRAKPEQARPEKAVGHVYGAPYWGGWETTLRMAVLRLVPYIGSAIVADNSRWVIPLLIHLAH